MVYFSFSYLLSRQAGCEKQIRARQISLAQVRTLELCEADICAPEISFAQIRFR
jgi:hypothetical protein